MPEVDVTSPVVDQIAPSGQNGDIAPETPDTPEPVAADPTEPVAELTDEQKNEQELKAREERSRKAQNGIQRRFREMADANERERARAEAAERRNDALLAAVLGRQATPQGSPDGEPQRNDPRFGGDYEKYVEARAEWKAEQVFNKRMADRDQSWQQQQANQQAAAQIRSSQQKIWESAKTVPEFAELVADNEDVQVGFAADAIVDSENPAALIAYFAKNHDAAARVAQLSPIAAAREVGKIELMLKGTPQVSKAPAPGKPVGAKPGSSSEPPEDPDAYMAWAAKNMR